jgi:ElaB/YqjD/DUF883 family membrane-anchored ribosome-binding protein
MENKTSAENVGRDLHDLSNEIQQGIQRGLYTWREIQHAVVAKTRETAATTDQFVHENPWKVVCWAAGLGLFSAY